MEHDALFLETGQKCVPRVKTMRLTDHAYSLAYIVLY